MSEFIPYHEWVVENGCAYCKEHGGCFCLICKERWLKDQHEKWDTLRVIDDD